MMSKEKILKGIDQQISNCYYCMIDDDLNSLISKEAVKYDKERMEALKEIRIKLEKLLI
jgi:hypothetical protein